MNQAYVLFPSFFLFALLVLGPPAAVWGDASEPVDPKALLQAAIDTARDAETLSAEITYTVHVRMAGMDQEIESRYGFAYEAPNKVAVVLREGVSGQTLISDGSQVIVHVPVLESYQVSEAAEDIGGVLEQGATFGGEMVMVLQSLMTGEAAGVEVPALGEIVHVGSESVGEGILHTVRLRLRQSEIQEKLGDEWREGMDEEELALFDALNFEIDLDLSILEGERTVLAGVRADLTEFMKQMAQEQMMPGMEDMEMEMVYVLGDWKVNESLPPDAFVFEAPDGTREVDDLFAALESGISDWEGDGGGDVLLGEAAPDFELALLEGGEATLSGHLGEDIVILDFWATWCGPCIQAMPALMEVASDYRDRNVVFYAVNLREGENQVRSFLEGRGWDLIVPMDTRGAVADSYGVSGIPHTVIIGKDGVIEKVHVGFSPRLKESLSNELDRLLGGE